MAMLNNQRVWNKKNTVCYSCHHVFCQNRWRSPKKSDRPFFLHVVHRVFQAILFFYWHLVPEWDKPDKRFFQDRDEEAKWPCVKFNRHLKTSKSLDPNGQVGPVSYCYHIRYSLGSSPGRGSSMGSLIRNGQFTRKMNVWRVALAFIAQRHPSMVFFTMFYLVN